MKFKFSHILYGVVALALIVVSFFAYKNYTKPLEVTKTATAISNSTNSSSKIANISKMLDELEQKLDAHDLDKVKAEIEALKDGEDKQKLQERLAKITDSIKLVAKAETAVKAYEDNPSENTRKEALDAINKVTNVSKKKELQKRFDQVNFDKDNQESSTTATSSNNETVANSEIVDDNTNTDETVVEIVEYGNNSNEAPRYYTTPATTSIPSTSSTPVVKEESSGSTPTETSSSQASDSASNTSSSSEE